MYQRGLFRQCIVIPSRNLLKFSRFHDVTSKESIARDQVIRLYEENIPLLPIAIEAFYTKSSHFVIPTRYTIPISGISKEDRYIWPEEVHGMKLWSTLREFLHIIHNDNLENNVEFLNIYEKIIHIGYPKDVKDLMLFEWKEGWLPAFKTFYEIHGHTRVSQSFVIPYGNMKWPLTTWGKRLGAKTKLLRFNRNSPSYIYDDLENLGFTFDVTDTIWKEQVLPALIAHIEIEGHADIRKTFKIPSKLPWPEKLWGVGLGSIVSNIKHKDYYRKQAERDRDLLESLGYASIFEKGAFVSN